MLSALIFSSQGASPVERGTGVGVGFVFDAVGFWAAAGGAG
jgi:hypothetical protein